MNQFRSGFVAVAGPANAGKSTLVNRLVGEKVSIVSPKVQTTRNRILGIKTSGEAQLILIDTPGFISARRGAETAAGRGAAKGRGALESALGEIATGSLKDVDLVLLVLDAQPLLRNQDYLDQALQNVAGGRGAVPAVIALNKIDLVEKAALLPLFERLSRCFPNQSVEFIPISARSGDGVPELERLLISLLPEGDLLFPHDQVTDVSERFLAAEVIREKLFGLLDQELPYSIAVNVESWRVDAEILKIGALITVERESQKGIVIGKGGQMLKKAGERARTELEKIFGQRIFLELLVRVDAGWTESAAGLRRAGVVNGPQI